MNRLSRILLVDDNKHDNFFHKRIIKKANCAEEIHSFEKGEDGLAFLSKCLEGEIEGPSLIFLDINMYGMDGWEFLDHFSRLAEKCQERMVVVMLSTTTNPIERQKAKGYRTVADFVTKPLTPEILEGLLGNLFPELPPA